MNSYGMVCLHPWMLCSFSSADFPQLATLPTPMPGSRRSNRDTSHHLTRPTAAQSMIKSSTNSITKLREFLEIALIWLGLVSLLLVAVVDVGQLTLCQGNHEANCDNGANLSVCVPGQLNFTGYRLHWKYVDAALYFPSRGRG
jgi:hypothetical protein